MQPLIPGGRFGCLLAGLLAGSLHAASALPAGGEFRVFDAAAKKAVALSAGEVREGAAYTAEGDGLRLHAVFETQRDYTLVRGEIESLRPGNRGLIVDYVVPPASGDAICSTDLTHSFPVSGTQLHESNVFPLAAMTGGGSGLALAIPPTEPRDFGLAADASGMRIRFYLGVSPLPRRFPNRAPFVFIVYHTDPHWGFRGALSRYYHFFPEFYTPRIKQDGIFMFQMDDRIPANVDQYGYDLVEMQEPKSVMAAAIARDSAHGITTFPYTIVGQREAKFLDQLPTSYEDAIHEFSQWTPERLKGHPLTKENITDDADIHIQEEVSSSACTYADGRYALVLRTTPWGGKSITFKTNPNPDLFEDQHRGSVGSYQLAVDERWLKEHPEFGGIFVDSLGANWLALYNYRQDHFVYARYPLTIDPSGRVALQNTTSHYEFIETLRNRLRKTGRLVMGNGIYTYTSRGAPRARKVEVQNFDAKLNEFIRGTAPAEAYRGAGTKLGRFFITALLDAATCERGSASTVEDCQDERVLMGQKLYAFINYHWTDQAQIDAFVNRSLAYGIYASSTTNFGTGEPYENNPKGYLRDKALLDWYVPLVRMVSTAGWEPVTDAKITGEDVSGERFGHGDTVYFTLFNDGDAAATTTLTVDLASLHFSPDHAVLEEISHQGKVQNTEAGSISVELPAKKTCVIRLTRRPS